MERLKGKVLVAQGGGPTPVVNQTFVGITIEARKFSHVDAVYGALHGVRGIVNEEFIDLTRETTHNLEQVADTPSGALLSTRDKPDAEYCERMFQSMRKHDIRYFFYVGGNDSADVLRIVSDRARETGYDLTAIHVPKTIDNDLPCNDHTPGFGSAARFVVQACTGLNLDSRALPGVLIAVVMGRHAGFLTASAALAKKYVDDGPHLIYLPERPFIVEDFLRDVDACMTKHGRCLVAVAEGLQDADGNLFALRGAKEREVDSHGNVVVSNNDIGAALSEEVKNSLRIKRVRSDTFGYLQRCFPGVVSDRDAHEAREVGEIAVQYAMYGGAKRGSVTIKRPVLDYSVNYEIVPVEEVAARTRHMEDEFIATDHAGVTDAFRHYCRPLLGIGLPEPHRLRAPKASLG